MSMAPVFRRLTATDLDAMRALLAVFADAFEDPATYRDTQPSDADLGRRLARPDIMVVTAHAADGAVVGGLVAYVLDKLEQTRSELYIYDLAVAEAHRRRGIGRGLIRHLQTLAPALGAWVVYVQADPEDAPALALYRGLGTEEAVFHYDFQVAPALP